MFDIVPAGMGDDLDDIREPAGSVTSGGGDSHHSSSSHVLYIPDAPAAQAATTALKSDDPVQPAAGDLELDREHGNGDQVVDERKDEGATRETRTSFKELCQNAPPYKLDIRILGDLPITLDELAAFFPMHYRWDPFLLRFAAAGWGSTAISRLMHHYRGNADEHSISKCGSNFQEKLSSAKKAVVRDSVANNTQVGKSRDGEALVKDNLTASSTAAPTTSTVYSTGSWSTPNYPPLLKLKNNMRLIDLAEDLQKWPTDLGRRHLTIAVEQAVHLKHKHVSLSNVRQYITANNLGEELEAIDAKGNPDQAALNRLKSIAYLPRGRKRAVPSK